MVGVTVPYEAKLEEIVLRFTPQRFKYVTSKPIHKSQKIVSEKDCIISLTVYHTLELEQQIFHSDRMWKFYLLHGLGKNLVEKSTTA